MIIGIPKEIMLHENRVSATPDSVKKYISDGARVLVEKGAGEGAFYSDQDYVSAGANIIADVKEIYQQADLILKVKEPQYNSKLGIHEIDLMHKGQYLITFIHPASPVNHQMVHKMAKNGILGLTLDGIPRISRAQTMDALTSMSTCAGYKGMLMAVNELTKFAPQIFTAVGMIKPINVLVIGTGVAGLQAIATAKRLGAIVHAIDIRPAAIEQATSLGAKIIDLKIPVTEAEGSGGYAKNLNQKWLFHEQSSLKDVINKMDIIYLSALVPNHIAPILITEDMLALMNPGSVIVDISIDQGGNCAATKAGETIIKNGITIIGIKNIPGYLSTSSTWMFAQNMYNLVKYLTKDGKIKIDLNDEICNSILVTDGEKIVHQGTLEAMAERNQK